LPDGIYRALSDRWRRFIAAQPPAGARPIDLSVLSSLRNIEQARLTDATFLENDLLPHLGLNDDALQEFPVELYPYCGTGLRHWQYPNQFSKYLVLLANFRIESYLEIGVRHGGTFLLTIEFLQRFNTLKKALGVDITDNPTVREYGTQNDAVCFRLCDSQSAEFKAVIEAEGPFDLTLIDGDHSESGCWHDFLTVRDASSIIAFHDIVSDAVPGVPAVWKRVREEYQDAFDFYEMVDQYPEVRSRTGGNYLGLGVAVRKGHPRRSL